MTTSEITDVPRQRRNDSRPSPFHTASSISDGSPLVYRRSRNHAHAAERARDQQGADPPCRGRLLDAVLQAAFVVAERRVLHVEQDRHHQRSSRPAAMPVSTTITQNRGVRAPAPPLVMFGCSIAPRPEGIRCFSSGCGRRTRSLTPAGRRPRAALSQGDGPWRRARPPGRSCGCLPGRRVVTCLVRDWRVEPGCACGDASRALALARRRAGKAADVPAPGGRPRPPRGCHMCLRHTPTVGLAAVHLRWTAASCALHGGCPYLGRVINRDAAAHSCPGRSRCVAGAEADLAPCPTGMAGPMGPGLPAWLRPASGVR
jgi:hypothetical protein